MAADSNFFDFFSIKLLKGNPEKILRDPRELILTESTARKYFDNDDPIGKTLTTPQGNFLLQGYARMFPRTLIFILISLQVLTMIRQL